MIFLLKIFFIKNNNDGSKSFFIVNPYEITSPWLFISCLRLVLLNYKLKLSVPIEISVHGLCDIDGEYKKLHPNIVMSYNDEGLINYSEYIHDYFRNKINDNKEFNIIKIRIRPTINNNEQKIVL